jgi:murein DD-endopeptidase MepM/ murein hydrolase activator NlpD
MSASLGARSPLDLLKDSLPAEGRASVIVTHLGQAIYIDLSRLDLSPAPAVAAVCPPLPAVSAVCPPLPVMAWRDRGAAASKREIRLRRFRTATIGLAFVLIAAMGLRSHLRLNDLGRTLHELAEVSGQQPDLARQDLVAWLRTFSVREAEVKSLRADAQRHRDSVMLHLEATRHLAKENAEHIFGTLRAAGLRPQDILREPSGAMGGSSGLNSASQDALSALIDSQLTDWLARDAQLRVVLASMPTTWPMRQYRLTSVMGFRRHPLTGNSDSHDGIDMTSPDRRVYSAGVGTIKSAGTQGGYVNLVVVEHPNGLETRYAHLDAINVRAGQAVDSAALLGMMGNTGSSTGPHLHFEVLYKNRPIDPQRLLGSCSHVQ